MSPDSFLWLALLAYLVGGIPFGLLFSLWLAKRDPRKHGSGNIGATNALRTGGKKVGALTLLADIGKGSLVVAVALSLGLADWQVACIALLAFLGHIYPIYLRFRGGKGVATMFGVLLPWQPWLAVMAFVVWYAVLKWRHYVSLASIVAGWSLPCGVWLLGSGREALYLGVILAALMTWRHRENIQRLLQGTEPTTNQDRRERMQA